MKTIQIQNDNKLKQVEDYLKGLDLLEKVSGYDEWTKKSWEVTHTVQELVGIHWVDIVLYAFWAKDEYQTEPELKEFLIESVSVRDLDGNEVLDTGDCIIYMNNPLHPTFEEEIKSKVKNIHESVYIVNKVS